ncbi:hypothetical protein BA195_13910 [Tenacibaculum soleae]|uniref:Phage abortive infection protein n=1 Tax=Tenacibaculum soleae TaxID=447689 RepID=A0A1B9XYQ9_9FLAO|nr:putative phage abortive infection protein [Tenacibaculum soleae]OCK42684.1 hypothetical protein BA195_13910 [Tenacibaculum soleae]
MKKKEKDYKLLIIFGALFIIISLWLLSWYYTNSKFPYSDCMPQKDISRIISERGAFGDKFGFINSLFSGLALTGIIISIYFQQKELSLQREELIETREEFKDQNFQTTYFNLVKTQREIALEINSTVWNLKNYKEELSKELNGRDFFIESRKELKKINDSLKHKDYLQYTSWNDIMEYAYEDEIEPQSEEESIFLFEQRKQAYNLFTYKIEKKVWEKSKLNSDKENAKLIYNIFLNRHHFVIGHYFRHLYHILNFLNEKEIERKKDKTEAEIAEIEKEFRSYANFAQAQMSTPELFLTFYNCIVYPKLEKLVIKYDFIENLNIENLIDEKHNCFEGIKLKRKVRL